MQNKQVKPHTQVWWLKNRRGISTPEVPSEERGVPAPHWGLGPGLQCQEEKSPQKLVVKGRGAGDLGPVGL